MNEKELIQAVIRKLNTIEYQTAKQDDVLDLVEQLQETTDAIQYLHVTVAELKSLVDTHYIENMNADDMIMRSFVESMEK
ncbi:hypothetical protein [Alkalicoccus chagannorensis]|uniref:hypothetical protein n=1 Tax=Alkalicoccus chagannorensis TaxID=427072 RepID=UPI000414F806|nr:hypothetical protein [Alkalicoccus chagannorensis]